MDQQTHDRPLDEVLEQFISDTMLLVTGYCSLQLFKTRPDTRPIDSTTGACSPHKYIMTATQTTFTRKTRDFHEFANSCETDGQTDEHTH